MAKARIAAREPVWKGGPFIVVAKKAMYRGGRHWTAGVHEFVTQKVVEEIGDDDAIEAMLSSLANYPADFEIKQTAEFAPAGQQQQQQS